MAWPMRSRGGARAHRSVALGALVGALLALPCAARAQQAATAAAILQGMVTDTAEQPLAGVTVTFTGDGAAAATTDSAGHFRLRGLPGGKVEFTARRLGFAPARFDIEMPARATVHVAIRMGRAAVVLGTVVVDGRVPGARGPDMRLLEEGFYNRRRAAHGQFISPEQVERRRMTHASALFRDVPSVTVRRGGAGQTVLLVHGTAGYCPLDVWVDGYYTPLLASLSFDDVVNMSDVKAAEVYRSWRDVPPRFQRPGADCGAVVVWTAANDDP